MTDFSNPEGGLVEGALREFTFPGPAGPLEGLWKDASGAAAGSAVFAHPHPLHGGTLHNKVVFRAARALTRSGYGTLRFNFRGVGRSAGKFDGHGGEVADFRAAQAEAARRAGVPQVAGGFSFGAAMSLRAIEGDSRVGAYIGVGLPVASAPRPFPRPEVPSLFIVGGRDTFGPPGALREFVGGSGEVLEIEGADHFLEGRLSLLEEAIARFLAELPAREAAS